MAKFEDGKYQLTDSGRKFVSSSQGRKKAYIRKRLVEIPVVNATTASRRMEDLTDSGLVNRIPLEDKQKRVEYSLTEKGKKLVPIIRKIAELE